MNIPIEAELAVPPIYTDKQERAMQAEGTVPDSDTTDRASTASDTTVTSWSPQHNGAVDVEKGPGAGEMVVFEIGESPREWSAGKKWQVHLSDLL
jgi:hypothetical protein